MREKVATLLSGAARLWTDRAGAVRRLRSFSVVWASVLSLCIERDELLRRRPLRRLLGATPGNLGFLGGAAVVPRRAAEGKLSLGGLGERTALVSNSRWARRRFNTPSFRTRRSPRLARLGGRGLGVEGELPHAFALRVDLQTFVYPTDIRSTWAVENQLFAGLTAAWHPGDGR